jgi:hypothetical protein
LAALSKENASRRQTATCEHSSQQLIVVSRQKMV